MRARKRWLLLACSAVVLVAACHRPPSAGFGLVLSETGVTIDQGAAGATEVAAECDPGFVGTAMLTLAAAPVGVSGTFVPDALSCGDTSTLTLEVAASTEPGVHAVHVQGESDGIVAQVQLTLTVAAGPTDFAISLSPASLTIEQTLQATVAVTLVRNPSFPDDIVLAIEDAPTGIAGSFEPDPVTGATSSLSLQVGSDAAVGVHALTVEATSGAVKHSADLTLTVAERGFRLVGMPSEVDVDAPGSRVLPVGIERTASFTEALTLTLEGAPAGVGGSFVPNPSTTTGTTLTLTVADTVAGGSYALTVRAESATGYSDARAFSLIVTAGTVGGFDVLVEPTSLTLLRGQHATVAVTIERTAGFVDPVALSAVVDPSPQHIDLTFDPVLAADASTMTVAIGINVPPGSYQITVQGLSDRRGDNASIGLQITE